LAKQQLGNLSGLGVSHFVFGRADYDFNDGLILGRGHGGTAIYWSKNSKASSFSNCDGSTSRPVTKKNLRPPWKNVLDIVQKMWAPLGKLFAFPGVPSWLRAWIAL